MNTVLSRLTLSFVIVSALLIVLGITGVMVIMEIPAGESNLGGLRIPLLCLCLFVPLIGIAVSVYAVRPVSKELALYEQILDAIPFPITVTDMNMKWLFVNKLVCDMLNRKRGEFRGKHCSEWGAAICNTENCGIACLRSGKSSTVFSQMGNDYHVDVYYFVDRKGNKAGHIELVRDITMENTLKRKQSEVVNYLTSVSDSFSSASKQIADGSQALARGAAEQAVSIEELSASVSKINGMAKDNTRATAETFDEMQQAGTLMGVCMEQMKQMLESMRMIDEKSQNISKTTQVVDDIAFQTKTLAINAAVEAARAGQHGKAFAVVAEEVRNLASKSAEAASETAALIQSSSESVTEGNRIVEKVNESLQAMVEITRKNAAGIADVKGASVQQGEAMEQVTVGINQIANVVQQNSATAGELASTSAEISSQAEQIHEMILSLGNNDISADKLPSEQG